MAPVIQHGGHHHPSSQALRAARTATVLLCAAAGTLAPAARLVGCAPRPTLVEVSPPAVGGCVWGGERV